jgi:hypothetical protein
MPATEVYYTITTSRLDAQMQQIDQLDTKAATVFTFASVILAFFAGLLPITTLPAASHAKIFDIILLFLAGIVYSMLVVCIFKAYQARDWSLRPDLTALQTHYVDYDEQNMQEWIADECLQSIQSNEPLIKQKASWLNKAFITLACEVGLIVVTAGLTLLAR